MIVKRTISEKVFTWVDDFDRETVECGCGGVFEPLKVEPDRSETSFVVRIWLCNTCKTLIPEGPGGKAGA